MTNDTPETPAAPRLTSLSHGGGCGCKIAPDVLRSLLQQSAVAAVMPADLLVGNESSDDSAVYRMNDEQALVATTDFFMPIVDDPFVFGQIAATNAISDIYAMGATPIMALALVGMPVNVLPATTIAAILDGGKSVCSAAGIPIAGGHTIDSVEPIYGLVVLGLVHPDRVLTNRAARAGDVLVLGKPLGVGVLSAALKKEALSEAGYRQLVATTTRLNTPGPDLARIEGVHSMTDVTGFGLGGHLLEMLNGAGLSADLDWSSVPLIEGVADLARQGTRTGASPRNWNDYGGQIAIEAGLDASVQTLISDPQTSGGLLVACAPEALDQVLASFRSHGFGTAAAIGRVGPAGDGAPLRVA